FRSELRFKPHPFTGSRSAATRHSLSAVCGMVKAAGKVVLGDSDSLHEAMNWSDLLITDVSSVLNEFLVTNKPIVVCNPQHLHEAEMHGTYPSSRAAYILNDAAGFSSLIEHICASDPKATTRLEVRKDSLGDFEGSALERFTRVLGDSLKAH